MDIPSSGGGSSGAPPVFPSDEAAMRAIQSGHLSLLGLLYERHSRRVFAQCRRMVGESRDVDDLVQEAFLRVLRYRGGFRGEARFSSWLYSITRNVCLDHLRRQSRERAAGPEATGDGDGEIATRPSEGERVAVLRNALDRLPAAKRELLLLCRLEGLSYAQLAERLGVREGTIRVRVHRALSELRAIFDSLWEGAP